MLHFSTQAKIIFEITEYLWQSCNLVLPYKKFLEVATVLKMYFQYVKYEIQVKESWFIRFLSKGYFAILIQCIGENLLRENNGKPGYLRGRWCCSHWGRELPPLCLSQDSLLESESGKKYLVKKILFKEVKKTNKNLVKKVQNWDVCQVSAPENWQLLVFCLQYL